jgi:hypothetical protein
LRLILHLYEKIIVSLAVWQGHVDLKALNIRHVMLTAAAGLRGRDQHRGTEVGFQASI